MIQSNGLIIDRFYIPPFTVDKGDIVIIELPNGPYFTEVLFKMVDILTNKEFNTNVTVDADFKFVNHITETGWSRFFRPMTVGRFIKRHGNPLKISINKVCYLCDIKPSTEIRQMPGNPRKVLSMLTTLSWTGDIIFDLLGVDPMGSVKAYEIAKEIVRNGGTVILLDNWGEFMDDCTRYIKYEVMSPIPDSLKLMK